MLSPEVAEVWEATNVEAEQTAQPTLQAGALEVLFYCSAGPSHCA